MQNRIPQIEWSWQKAVIGIILILTALYLAFSVAAPKKKISTLAVETAGEELAAFGSDSAVIMLLRERAFVEAKLDLANGDSIGLVIDLSKGTAGIQLKGVSLYETHIKRSKEGKFLSSLDSREYENMLGKAVPIIKQKANIEKIPVRIIDAPDDTATADPEQFVPDTGSKANIHLSLMLGNGIKLLFIDNESGNANLFLRSLKEKTGEAIKIVPSVIQFKTPDYHPVIRIYMSSKEIETIYRAIPVHGRIVLRV